jgi:hypothetical protein
MYILLTNLMEIDMDNAPRLHWNGTSRERLMEVWLDASDYIGLTIVMLRRAAPHERDYPLPWDKERFKAAVEQHRAHVQALESMASYTAEMIQAIESQDGKG